MSFGKFVHLKRDFKGSLLKMLDPYRSKSLSSNQELPQIEIRKPGNLSNVVHLLQLGEGLYDPHYKRGQFYCAFIVALYAIQFLYIFVKLVIFKQEIFQESSMVFGIYAVVDFIVITLYMQPILLSGTQANLINVEIKKILQQLRKDCILCKKLAYKQMVHLNQQDEIKLLEKVPSGYRCIDTDQYFSNLAKFTPISEELVDTIEQLEDEIEFADQYMDFKIEHSQVKLFGIDISYDLQYNVNSSVVIILASMVQEMI